VPESTIPDRRTGPSWGPSGSGRSDAIELGGTVRTIDAEATFANARKLFGQVGITRIGNVTGLDHVGIPTWVAVRPLSRSLSVSQGKGMSHALARASAAMESIELHHAECFVPRGRDVALREAASDPDFASPLMLPIHAEAVVTNETRCAWIPGRAIRSGRTAWIPREVLDLDSTSRRAHSRIFVTSSNGLASGNTRDEALLHAVCEVVERDQVALWSARQFVEPDVPNARVDLHDIADPHCRDLLERCAAAGLRIAVWHVSQDIPVPCFACKVFDSKGRTCFARRASGFGCHPYRHVALARAMTEALQSRLTFIAGGRDDLTWRDYRDAIPTDRGQGLQWATGVEEEAETVLLRSIAEAPRLDTIGALLDWTLDALDEVHLPDAIAVDLTQEQLGIPVVHVTVPGLEGHVGGRGYSPGPRMQQVLSRHAMTTSA